MKQDITEEEAKRERRLEQINKCNRKNSLLGQAVDAKGEAVYQAILKDYAENVEKLKTL